MILGNNNDGFCMNCGAQLDSDATYCPQCGIKIMMEKNLHSGDALNVLNNFPDTSNPNQLFSVFSIINSFRYKEAYYDNVKIYWFYKERKSPQVSFEDVITNYDNLNSPERITLENFVMECFTQEEANALKEYLVSIEKTSATVIPCNQPFDIRTLVNLTFSSKQEKDIFNLSRRPLFNLPFTVEGRFNIKNADECIRSDDRATVVTRAVTPEMLRK